MDVGTTAVETAVAAAGTAGVFKTTDLRIETTKEVITKAAMGTECPIEEATEVSETISAVLETTSEGTCPPVGISPVSVTDLPLRSIFHRTALGALVLQRSFSNLSHHLDGP